MLHNRFSEILFCNAILAFFVVIYGEGTPNAAHSIYAICLSQHVAYFHS